MKNRKFLYLLPLLISFTITSCVDILPKVEYITYDIDSSLIEKTSIGINKVKNKYNYSDVSQNSAYSISSCPSVGNPKILVVPIWFTDSSLYIKNKDTVRGDIETAYFGSISENGWESVSTYYEKDSFNNVHLSGVVSPWYEVNASSEYYYNASLGEGQPDKVSLLVEEVVNWYKSISNLDTLVDFDSDKDGYLDGVALVYGAPNYQSLGRSDASNLWAYCYWLSNPDNKNINNPGPNVFNWSSYDFMYDSSTALIRAGSYYGYGDTRFCNVDSHTYIHEFGHTFGLQDYYDYNRGSSYCPGGAFSMQDYNVGAHDPFSRFALGWIKPYVPIKTSTFTLKTIESSGEAILLSYAFDGSPFDEYILLELYSSERLNEFDASHEYRGSSKGPESVGVRVWHIDARLARSYGYRWKITNNPTKGYVINATDNTSGEDSYSNYFFGNSNYNTMQLIRNDTNKTYEEVFPLEEDDLFKAGDSFSIEKYRNQFPGFSSDFNNGDPFYWTVTFNSLTDEGMTITCKLG